MATFQNLTLSLICFDACSARYEASVADEYDIDDGPSTFTMQDHLNFLVSVSILRDSTISISDLHLSDTEP